jgi:hypothetical protein
MAVRTTSISKGEQDADVHSDGALGWWGFNLKAVAAALLVITSMTAQAAEPETLTLACQGTQTKLTELTDAKPESQSISMGIVVNLTARTVEGFIPPGVGEFPVKIDAINQVTVSFGGYKDGWRVVGGIDRVTGDVDATIECRNQKTGNLISGAGYSLKCKPAKRMF